MSAHFPNLSNGATASPANGISQEKAMSNYAHYIVERDALDVNSIVEFPELTMKVRQHLASMRKEPRKITDGRALWIQGRPGEGKTTGILLAAVIHADTAVARIPASDFAGAYEGASSEKLADVLSECEAWSKAKRKQVALLVDDVDLSVANVSKDTGHAVNTQLFVNKLMAVCDDKSLYLNNDGTPIPLLFSANDASGMREILTRPGRAKFYTHQPTVEDRMNIAWAILAPKTSEERDVVAKVTRKCRHQPIAFWHALAQRIRDIYLAPYMSDPRLTTHDLARMQAERVPLTPEIVWTAVEELRRHRAENFLRKASWLKRLMDKRRGDQ